MKSAISLKTLKEISWRKNSNRARLKAKSDKERIYLWHDHFKELLGNETSSSIHIAPDENEQESNIKLGLFTNDKLIKATKAHVTENP